MIRLALFDCDGTLVDSGAAIRQALEETFEAHGLECPPPEVTKKVIGLSLEQAFESLSPDADRHALTQTYKEAFFAMRGRGEVEEPLFDGIVELLDALEADDWLLGVATGKSDRGLRHCLERNGLEGRFVTLQTSDRNPSKPHPGMAIAAMDAVGAQPGGTVFVGDTAWDMGCAVGAGTCAIAAAWGYHDVDELREAGAHHIADLPASVLAAARQWVGGRN